MPRAVRAHPPLPLPPPGFPLVLTLTFYAFPYQTTLPAAIIQRVARFPAVIPPTNRYQMGKIELVRATLVIMAWPPISTTLPSGPTLRAALTVSLAPSLLAAHVRGRR